MKVMGLFGAILFSLYKRGFCYLKEKNANCNDRQKEGWDGRRKYTESIKILVVEMQDETLLKFSLEDNKSWRYIFKKKKKKSLPEYNAHKLCNQSLVRKTVLQNLISTSSSVNQGKHQNTIYQNLVP